MSHPSSDGKSIGVERLKTFNYEKRNIYNGDCQKYILFFLHSNINMETSKKIILMLFEI